MLSRVAEALYWTGRYVERAEDTARLLDVHVHGLLEEPWVDEPQACRDLFMIMGVQVPKGPIGGRLTTERLAFFREDTTSIVGALAAARDSARGVREALSSELWECLNGTFHALDAQVGAARRHGPHGFFAYVRERAAIVGGLLDGTMPRDDGWRFLVLGRSLERVDMTARLLWASLAYGGARTGWVRLLRSCSGHEAYLRAHRVGVEPDRVVAFLLLDRLFPRSVYSALALAEKCLTEIDPAVGRTGVDDAARRLLGRARTDLEFRSSTELIADLPDVLDALQRTCSEVGSAVGERYFAAGPALTWAADADRRGAR
ncbi:MAG: alpha-E domain-containing protein [Actinomycetota bacterium]|nr:alpha-E domain-containing protein [Actinomycetota bacterium]